MGVLLSYDKERERVSHGEREKERELSECNSVLSATQRESV